ncbi:LysR family transcriptional regulator [Pantoea sp. App145]|uniref:LysR family transcriptional regulator n=1 Tax=Pantoea sp. App145 TaxID=3071567 RepID=UPI003A803C78
MDLNLLRVFIAIYETQSVTGAAERLFITQPSVSYALKRLRDEFDDALFSRNSAGMLPTFRAVQLYEVFKRAMSSIDQAVADSKTFDFAASTFRFTLALSDLGEFFFLPYIYRELQQVAPNVKLEVLQLDVDLLEDWLLNGKIDAAICNRNSKVSNVRCEVLLRDQYVCLLNKNHPRIQDNLTSDSFLKEKHITVSSQAGHHYVEERVRQAGNELHVVLRVPHFSALGELISSSECLTTLPSSIGHMFAELNEGRILPLPFNVPDVEVCLYSQMSSGDLPAKRWFCNMLKEVCCSVRSPVPRIRDNSHL